MKKLRPLGLAAGILVAAVTPSAAYYHYVHYLNSSSPYALISEKYDLSALPDKTVTFFVSDSGPTSYVANDSFPSVLGQIRNATQVWNSVATSDLRVAFGGLQTAGTTQSVPTGEVVFEEMPPGVLAFSGHAVTAGVATAADGTQFVPIVASLIHLNINLTQQPGSASTEGFPGPSYSESFFTTLVHEVGHALGLQHAFTSATMSTAVSRATSRLRPLDADDIAGVSLLYPRNGFPAGYGSITGQVTMSGQGVHLASVVALMPNGSAISNLTNPDGSYEIDGLPPGNYYVYVHPLPPTANIQWPLDPNGNPVPADGPFVSTFFPGTWTPSQFTSVSIAPGVVANGINFAVQPRDSVEVYDVTSYWYATSYNQPAYLSAGTTLQTVVAQGIGITTGTSSTPVQSVQAIGALGGILPDYSQYVYPDGDTVLLAMYFDYTSTPASGPEHLLFILPDDIFVLPQGIQMVQNRPPMVAGATPNADGSVTVTGTGLNTASNIFFDSLPGQIVVPYADTSASGDATAFGSVTVLPPPGAAAQTATITVYNIDGQSSVFLQAQNPFTYTYAPADAPSAAVSLMSLAQGITSMVRVTSSDMQFVRGQTTLGFGSGDVVVRNLWVVSSNEAWANVTVSPSALQQSTVASVISGFQVYEQPAGFQVMAADASLPTMDLPVPNAFYPIQNSLYPGAIGSIHGVNLALDGGTVALTIGGQTAQILYTSATLIYFVIPASMPTGPAVVRLNNGAVDVPRVVLQIDPRPPVILQVNSAAGVLLDASQSAAPGDIITLVVSGADPSAASNPARLAVAEGGVGVPTFTVQQAQDGSGNLLIQFALSASVLGQQIPISVSLDGNLSMPYYLNIGTPAAATN